MSGMIGQRGAKSGIVGPTAPNTPAFCVTPSDQNNLAASTYVDLVWSTTRFDQGDHFSTPNFTAPVTGKYHLSFGLRLQQIPSDAAYIMCQLRTSNRTYESLKSATADGVYDHMHLTVLADMDKNDTAYVRFYQDGGTAQTDFWAGSHFSGWLVC